MAVTSKVPPEAEPDDAVSVSGAKSATPQNGAAQAAPHSQTASYAPNYTRPTRRPADERENAFDVLAWMVEGAAGIADELRHNDLGLSEEFWTHAAAARRETLLAMHAALESIIEKTNAAEKEQQERTARRERRGGIDIDS